MMWRGLAAGWIAFGATNLALVLVLFGPVADLPPPGTPPVHPLIGFGIYITAMVALFAWLAQKLGSPWQAAATLGAAQFLLVNVDMVLRGDRAFETAAASTVMMVVTWTALAAAWRLVVRSKAD